MPQYEVYLVHMNCENAALLAAGIAQPYSNVPEQLL